MGLDEQTEYMAEFMAPMDEVLEKMMDRFLELPKHRRKEINQILKDAKRGR
jgi:ATP-dependent Zn protease